MPLSKRHRPLTTLMNENVHKKICA